MKRIKYAIVILIIIFLPMLMLSVPHNSLNPIFNCQNNIIQNINPLDWDNNGNAISTATSTQTLPQMCSDGAGGAIITWKDSRNGNWDIYAQKILASGSVAWTADGVAICTATGTQEYPRICSDGSGGAIIAWQDSRAVSKMYAQRILSNGNLAWTPNGTLLSALGGSQQFPQMCSDGAGGAIITFMLSYNDIYAQKILSNGNLAWTANGVAICTADESQQFPQICSDGAGGAIIAWQDNRDPMSFYPDIYAQKVLTGGSVAWTANGTAISNVGGSQIYCDIVSDGVGGAIITWLDDRGGSAWDIYAQKIFTGGSVSWTANGTAICTATGNQYNQMCDNYICSDGLGGAIITWDDQRSGNWDTYAQKILSVGIVAWTANGVPICTAINDQMGAQICSDGAGGAIITWDDKRSGNYDIYTQKILTGGSVSWTANGTPICTAINDQIYNYVLNNAGEAIITWQDYRDGNWDIYASISGIPTIIGKEQIPVSPTNLDSVNITVHVADNIGVSVVLIETNHTGSLTNYAMDPLSGTAQDGYWNYTIPVLSIGTTVSYSFYANDTSSNEVTDGPFQYTVISENPMIDVSRDPNSPGNLDPVNVTAHITDNVEVHIVLIESNHSGAPTNYTMDFLSGTVQDGYWNFTIPAATTGTTVVYTIYANDTNNNPSVDGPYQYLVYDNEDPTIIGKEQIPVSPTNLDSVNITVHVADNTGVSVVLIETNHTGSLINYTMDPLSGTAQDGYWNFTIPVLSIGTTVSYSFYANDTSSNGVTDGPYQYTVTDGASPMIDFVSRDPNSPGNLDPVNVTAHITDNVEVHTVLIESNHSGTLTNYTMDFLSGTVQDGYWNFTIPAATTGTTVVYTIYANDTNNNPGVDGPYQYVVIDNENPVVVNITRNPTTPTDLDNLKIIVYIMDNVGVHTVVLTSNHTGVFVNYTMILMSGTAQNGYWSFTLPRLAADTHINFSIWVNDTSGNFVISPYYNCTIIKGEAGNLPLLAVIMAAMQESTALNNYFATYGLVALLITAAAVGSVVITRYWKRKQAEKGKTKTLAGKKSEKLSKP